jgi:hypothetical protein
MKPRSWLIGLGLATVLAGAAATEAGGPGMGLSMLHGTVEIKPVGAGEWQRAQPGELLGTYLVRTGPRSWAHLRDYAAEDKAQAMVGCLDANSLVRVRSSCGFDIEVLRGRISAIDGRPGKALFRVASR